MNWRYGFALMAMWLVVALPSRAADMGTAFTYQGYLEKPAGTPVTSTAPHCDFEFSLWDAAGSGSPPTGGTQVGTSQTVPGVTVTGGVFTVGWPDIDFGDGAFNGAARWLAIEVKCPPDVVFTALAPRVELQPAPYAIRAMNGVGPPDTIEIDAATGYVGIGTNSPSGQLDVGGGGLVVNGSMISSNCCFSHASPGCDDATCQSTVCNLNPFCCVLGWFSGCAADAADLCGTLCQQPQVGIGTTTPAFPLSFADFSGDKISLWGGAGPHYGFGIQGGLLQIHTFGAADDVAFGYGESTAFTETMRIKGNGNVGIGTNAPAESLDVAGNIHASGTIASGSSIVVDGTAHTFVSDADLELHVANGRALRIESNPTSPNLVGGYSGNSVTAGVVGATIGGGGSSGFRNRVTDNYGTLGGGLNNLVGDNAGTSEDRQHATVGGGQYNIASGSISTVGGGSDNRAGGFVSTVGGGLFNVASGTHSTVGGGFDNTASGNYSVVPGGSSNDAGGEYSFAAGSQAQVRVGDAGTFVWADSTNAPFQSTGSNQFLIRATGGVGIGTTNPTGKLHISSSTNDQIILSSPLAGVPQVVFQTTAGVNDSSISYDQANDLLYLANGSAARLVVNNSGNIGIGTSAPTHPLHMASGAYVTAGGVWTDASSRELKENFTAAQGRELLDKLAWLPIATWNYKNEDDSIRHLGPVAEDFFAAFGTGADDKHLAALDTAGVALAAIQGLYEIVQEKDCEIEELKAKAAAVEQLEAKVAALETLVSKLAAQNKGGSQ